MSGLWRTYGASGEVKIKILTIKQPETTNGWSPVFLDGQNRKKLILTEKKNTDGARN